MSGFKPPIPLQFNLRWLFAATTLCALCAFVYRLSGPYETAFIAVALILLPACAKLWKGRAIWLRSILLMVPVAMIWMAAFDLSYFHEGCSHCNSHWYRGELRVLRQPFWSWKGKDHFPIYRLIAEDLGAPCPHDYERTHLMRLCGFWWPGSPFINPTCCLTGRDWYDEPARQRVRELAANDPALSAEFQQRGLLEHDRSFLLEFFGKVNPQPP
jgi:hypothetical protein